MHNSENKDFGILKYHLQSLPHPSQSNVASDRIVTWQSPTHESSARSLSASPASTASRAWASCRSAGVIHLVLCGYQFVYIAEFVGGLDTHEIR